MKTSLPERSLVIKERLERIVEQILAIRKGKIAMIILFGSYARGDWVSDEYVEGGVAYIYQSDIDLLIILRKENNGRDFALRMEDQIERRLEYKGIEDVRKMDEPLVSLVIETIGVVNGELKKGQYFYSDIKREGVMLYDNGEFKLEEVGKLVGSERAEVAKKDFRYCYNRASKFLELSKVSVIKEFWNESAFLLHQATESFYNAVLLVFSGYKLKLHDIKKLRKRANSYDGNLVKIFLFNTGSQRECFDLLRRAYIEARYDESYRISKGQLEYLMERVEELKVVTEKVCKERIKEYESNENSE